MWLWGWQITVVAVKWDIDVKNYDLGSLWEVVTERDKVLCAEHFGCKAILEPLSSEYYAVFEENLSAIHGIIYNQLDLGDGSDCSGKRDGCLYEMAFDKCVVIVA